MKCPYCHRDDTTEYKDAKFCLQKHDGGSIHLDHGHAYYYQVQTQLFICEADFCDFCICTFGDQSNIFVERIHKNQVFWDDCVKKFFNTCLFSELIGHWYIRQRIMVDKTQPTQQFDTSNDVYCYCRDQEEGKMIGYDNPDCSIK